MSQMHAMSLSNKYHANATDAALMLGCTGTSIMHSNTNAATADKQMSSTSYARGARIHSSIARRPGVVTAVRCHTRMACWRMAHSAAPHIPSHYHQHNHGL